MFAGGENIKARLHIIYFYVHVHLQHFSVVPAGKNKQALGLMSFVIQGYLASVSAGVSPVQSIMCESNTSTN